MFLNAFYGYNKIGAKGIENVPKRQTISAQIALTSVDPSLITAIIAALLAQLIENSATDR